MTTYNFSRNNQIFINESLMKTNESLAFCGRKLKRSGLIHSCYTKDVVVHIKKTILIHCLSNFQNLCFLMMMMKTVSFFLMLHQMYQVNLYFDLIYIVVF